MKRDSDSVVAKLSVPVMTILILPVCRVGMALIT